MKYLLPTILTIILAFALFITDARAGSTDVVVTDNIIEAIHNIDIVSLNVLLAEGAAIDTADGNGNTPLMLASKIGNPRMIKIILAHNPEVNSQNNDGYTALMVASENGQYYIAAQLIRVGADISAKNKQGLTAAEIALRFGQPQINNLINGKEEVPFTR